MRTVSQDEASQRLPDLLREANRQSVVICEAERELGALISMEDYEIVRAARRREFDRICAETSANVAAHAAELGISVDELTAQLLEE